MHCLDNLRDIGQQITSDLKYYYKPPIEEDKRIFSIDLDDPEKNLIRQFILTLSSESRKNVFKFGDLKKKLQGVPEESIRSMVELMCVKVEDEKKSKKKSSVEYYQLKNAHGVDQL